MYYGTLKVSVKSSYFRVKERPSFVVYGKKGMFIKQSKDRQEEHLKLFYMPTNKILELIHRSIMVPLSIMIKMVFITKKVVSVIGDYARVYDGIYDCIVKPQPQIITHEQTLLQMEILETGISKLK